MPNRQTTELIGPQAREVRRALADAADENILRVLRYVEALPDRGAADGLLAPVRDRLRQLRPPRVLRFPRVLFTPLDPVIVNAASWKATAARVPQSAIVPMSNLVRLASPAEAAAVDDILADGAVPERVRIASAGAILWPVAALALRGVPVPADWAQAALPQAAFVPLAEAVAMCLEQAARVEALSDPAATAGDVEDALENMLRAAQQQSAISWGMVLTLLLQNFPAAEAPRKAALQRADTALRVAAEHAVESGWNWIEAGVEDSGVATPAEAASRLRRRVSLLSALARDPAQHVRATLLQGRLRQACAARLEAGFQEDVIAPLTAENPTQPDHLEEDIRDLLRLEAEARPLNGGAAHDLMLKRAADAAYARQDLAPMERARLIELLLGSAAAHAVLGKARKEGLLS